MSYKKMPKIMVSLAMPIHLHNALKDYQQDTDETSLSATIFSILEEKIGYFYSH